MLMLVFPGCKQNIVDGWLTPYKYIFIQFWVPVVQDLTADLGSDKGSLWFSENAFQCHTYGRISTLEIIERKLSGVCPTSHKYMSPM